MRELLINKDQGGFVNCSPGPQTLIGYVGDDNGPGTEKGFFGEVPASDFIQGQNLAALVGLTIGSPQYDNEPWLKFLLDGSIIFIPRKAIRHTVNWLDLQAKELVFGTRIITIGQCKYRIRLLKALGPNTSGFIGNVTDDPSTIGSEWNRLLHNVGREVVFNQVGPKWANYPSDASTTGLNLIQDTSTTTGPAGTYTWCQEASPKDSSIRLYRGGRGLSYLYSYASAGTSRNRGWRPVLELVKDTE